MAPQLRQANGHLLLVLSNAAQGWSVPTDGLSGGIEVSARLGEAALFPRQDSANCADDISDPDTPLCSALCAPSSSSCSSRFVERRNAPGHHALPGFHASVNNASLRGPYENHLVARRLSKRAFTPITQGDIATYRPNQFNGNGDEYFGKPIALVSFENGVETDETVVSQQILGNKPFAVGSRGLHGCTIVTIFSNQAAYMVDAGPLLGDSSLRFLARQRNSGKECSNIFNGGTPLVGAGPVLDSALFPLGSTRVYIMTTCNRYGRATSSNYRGKVPTLKQTIRSALQNDNVPLVLYNYKATDYANEADRAQIGKNERGAAL